MTTPAIPSSYCGYTDWRLPNRNELRSLVNYGEANVANWLNTQGFSNVQAWYYWSSTSFASSDYANNNYPSNTAWSVNMLDGAVYDGKKSYDGAKVWPVRGTLD